MPPEPLVSVVIPAFNGARFLVEAVGSVLAQGYERLEIVVVDDGSTDDTAAIATRLGPPVRLFRQANRGVSAARNVGLREASGEIIAFLDVDDLWPVGKLALQLSRLAREPELEIVLGRVQLFGELNAVDRRLVFEGPDQTLMNVNLGAGLFRRAVFDRVGDFDERLRNYEDHDWFLRAREHGVRTVILRQPTLYYRRHPASTTYENQQPWSGGFIGLLKSSLDRRRTLNAGVAPVLPRFTDADEAAASPDAEPDA